jgi:hypothetical protein
MIMTKQEILDAIRQLPSEERISLMKAVLDLFSKESNSRPTTFYSKTWQSH